MKQFNWKNLLLIAFAFLVINQMASYFGKNSGTQANETENLSLSAKVANQEVQVVVSSQDSEGLTQQNFDLIFLKNLEARTVERVRAKIRELPNSPAIDITSEANYVESGSMKWTVIRLRGSDGSNQVMVSGIVGKEFKRVTCVKNSPEAIPISYGLCGEKIKEIFGTKIGA